MSDVIVALQEDQVTVTVGRSGRLPNVKNVYSAQTDDSGILGYEKAVTALFDQHKLNRKNITLVLPASSTVTKMLSVPKMSEKQLAEFVSHEMQSIDKSDTVSDYTVMKTDKSGHCELFCVSCPKDELSRYIRIFERNKISIKTITVPIIGHLRLIKAINEFKNKNCIWLSFEGDVMTSLLIENGEYRYSSRSKIFSEPGTVDFATEINRNISGTLQFQAVGKGGYDVTDLFYSGTDDNIFEVCLSGIENFGLGVSKLPVANYFKLLDADIDINSLPAFVGIMMK